MSQKTEIMTAVGTLTCAIGIGFVMQSGESAKLRYGPEKTDVAQIASVVGTAADPMTPISSDHFDASDELPLEVHDITLTSANVAIRTPAAIIEDVVENVISDNSDADMPQDEATPVQLDCTISVEAKPAAAAMVELNLIAPCLSNEEVSIGHHGMTFIETTSTDGSLNVTVPALIENATYKIEFGNGETAEVSQEVSSVSLYDRVVLQWSGDAGVQIHAREFGADYGDDGHVWAGAARDITAVSSGLGGFLSSYGDLNTENPMMVEVYTFPASLTVIKGSVALSVEAEVTAANCGHSVEARALEVFSGEAVKAQNLTLAVPGCDAIGSFLVLNNLLQNLTVASN